MSLNLDKRQRAMLREMGVHALAAILSKIFRKRKLLPFRSLQSLQLFLSSNATRHRPVPPARQPS